MCCEVWQPHVKAGAGGRVREGEKVIEDNQQRLPHTQTLEGRLCCEEINKIF